MVWTTVHQPLFCAPLYCAVFGPPKSQNKEKLTDFRNYDTKSFLRSTLILRLFGRFEIAKYGLMHCNMSSLRDHNHNLVLIPIIGLEVLQQPA